jgi:hypothetical protein
VIHPRAAFNPERHTKSPLPRVDHILNYCMPHKRVSDPQDEGRILLAITAFKQGQFTSIRAAATAYDTPYITTLRRAQGRPSRSECQPNGQKLSSTEEGALKNWIISLDTRGFPPRISAVRDIANLLLAARTKSDLIHQLYHLPLVKLGRKVY